jgi:predicted transcriptional regulator
MTKSLMISIQPQHAVNILNGKKTLELRTWIPKDYVGWVYVYCTKEKNRVLLRNDLVDLKSKMYVEWVKNYDYGYLSVANKVNNFNENPNLIGKVVARFWFDEYEKVSLELIDKSGYDEDKLKEYESEKMTNEELLKKLCLDEVEIDNYLNSSDGYVWHIKKLEIFDEPKSLSDFNLIKAPQRSVLVYTKELENERP